MIIQALVAKWSRTLAENYEITGLNTPGRNAMNVLDMASCWSEITTKQQCRSSHLSNHLKSPAILLQWRTRKPLSKQRKFHRHFVYCHCAIAWGWQLFKPMLRVSLQSMLSKFISYYVTFWKRFFWVRYGGWWSKTTVKLQYVKSFASDATPPPRKSWQWIGYTDNFNSQKWYI